MQRTTCRNGSVGGYLVTTTTTAAAAFAGLAAAWVGNCPVGLRKLHLSPPCPLYHSSPAPAVRLPTAKNPEEPKKVNKHEKPNNRCVCVCPVAESTKVLFRQSTFSFNKHRTLCSTEILISNQNPPIVSSLLGVNSALAHLRMPVGLQAFTPHNLPWLPTGWPGQSLPSTSSSAMTKSCTSSRLWWRWVLILVPPDVKTPDLTESGKPRPKHPAASHASKDVPRAPDTNAGAGPPAPREVDKSAACLHNRGCCLAAKRCGTWIVSRGCIEKAFSSC